MIRPLTVAAEVADLSLRSQQARTLVQMAHAVMLADPTTGGPEGAAKRMGYTRAGEILKATVGATPLSDLPEYVPAASAFIGSIRSSAFEVLTRYMRRVPRRAAANLIAAVGSSEAEGLAKAVSRLTVGTGNMTQGKGVAYVVATKETLRAPDFSLDTLGDELRGAVAVAVDTPFLAALGSGASSVTCTGVFKNDMRMLLDSVPRGANSRPVFIGAADVRDELSLTAEVQRRTGRLPVAAGDAAALDIPFVTSDAATPGEMFLVDASRLAYWADPLEITPARHASIEMDSDPSASALSPPGVAASNEVSLFQTGSVAVLAERRFAVRKLTSNCVAKITGIAQGSPAVTW